MSAVSPVRKVGRPRAVARPRSGLSPREEILAAAAELFTTHGYAATTTRALAERAGIRQASLYHYFGGKEDLLAELLESTVRPSLEAVGALAGATPEERLWELCHRDARLLCSGPYNLGALYLLPEVRTERFAGFRGMREELKGVYGRLLAETPAGAALEPADRELRTDLLFALIEGVILIRRDTPGELAAGVIETLAAATADAALRLAGVGDRQGLGGSGGDAAGPA
ncbi:TetR family transcriptional regulator [[Actinomadura] parvosata subsp. kistnae]|uniref:TetR family transcriptional regulator n=1 Tax=[Actinomadura] parvosata subsp. kistnae TaxID=1909395 RepID=A0A1V0AJ65_9ACTN|nr:TetR/AcrR family transcriptional regulator [Nonomuraea sp. ATCC 55076]AQZ70246.1 TetR family transcriptional regulator [Nonomuraea sp. ATCC 55076]